MAEPKRIDYKKIDNFLKNSMDKPQWESNMKAIQSFEAKVQSLQVELREEDVTKESVAELLPSPLLSELPRLHYSCWARRGKSGLAPASTTEGRTARSR